MKHVIIICLAVLSQMAMTAHATIVQKLLLKNGSELEGYISKQRPGEHFTFTAERAVVYMADTMVQSIVPQEVGIEDLSAGWIKWAEQHDAFVGVGDNRKLLLSNIVTKNNSTIDRVRILERGAKIKYLDIGNTDYSLNWDTIALVKVEKRPKTALSGIDRTYKTVDGKEFTGQYVEEVPGKTLSLYRESDGVVEVFKMADVVKYTMQKINPNQTLFEQSELLDIVKLKDGSLLKGIVIEQNFNNKNSAEDYLLLQSANGTTQSVKLKDIEEYRKEVNPQYKPLYDILLNEGELVINRQATNAVQVKEEDGRILLSQDTCRVSVKGQDGETSVVIETRFALTERKPSLDIVKVREFPGKRKTPSMKGFSFEDIVKSDIRPVSVETSVNQTTRMEYRIAGKGLFVIYNPQEKTAIPFKIVE